MRTFIIALCLFYRIKRNVVKKMLLSLQPSIQSRRKEETEGGETKPLLGIAIDNY